MDVSRVKKVRWMMACLLCVLSLFFLLGELSAAEAATNNIVVDRVFGDDRYKTAIEIAKAGWSQGAETVVVATGEKFADALAGAPLAYHYSGPILLTRPHELLEEVREEIIRLGAKRVIILGGESALSSQVEQALKQMDGIEEVIRLGGDDRYETAVRVAEQLPAGQAAVLAYGRDFPDALSIAPHAARQGMPIFLTDGQKLDPASFQLLAQYQRIYLIGGTSVISKEVERQLVNQGLQVTRLGGANRYDTAVLIAEQLGNGASQVMLASGQKFADALTGSLLAAQKNISLLLTRQDRIVPELVQFNGRYQPKSYLIVGGEQAVSEAVVRSLKGIDGTVKIFIDPGHGGHDSGAVGNGLKEKDVNLDIALRLRNILTSEYKNVQVMMSRDKDVFISLQERTTMANQWGATYFLSLHVNAAGTGKARGFESYIYNKNPRKESIQYQEIIHNHVAKGLAEKYGVTDRGKKRANFHVVRESRMPAVLLENLFIDNPEDAKLLKDAQFRQDVARLIAEGLAQAFHLPKK